MYLFIYLLMEIFLDGDTDTRTYSIHSLYTCLCMYMYIVFCNRLLPSVFFILLGYFLCAIFYSVKHFNIDPRPEGFAMGIMQFSSIEEVVKHYQQNSLFVHDGQAVSLGQPVRRKSRGDIARYVH